jgi:transcription factor IIIB subunit 2
MKRDWMHYGRRPSGLCGAAILVAARLNEVHCSIKDIIKIVKVCETTIRKRLCEFSETPTSNLTLDEFMTIDLEGEEDPPCYKAAKRKQKLSQLENEQQLEEIQTKISHLQKLIEKDLEKSRKKMRSPYSKYLKSDSSTQSNCGEEAAVEEFIVADTVQTIEEVLNSDNNYDNYIESIKALRPTAASLGITPVVESNDNKSDAIVAEDVNESDELDLTGIDDEELDAYLLNVDEIDAKTNVWTRVHAEYLEEMKQKEEVKAREEEERKRKEASGEVQPKKKRKTRKKTQIQANSASEAIEKMLQEKKISNKINYDVLKNLNPSFGEKIQFKTPDIPIKEDLKIESQEQKLNSPLKRLTTLKNSANTSLLNLKAPLFSKLKMKASDQTISKEGVNEPESMTTATNSSVSYDKQTIISKESLEETDNINDDYEEEDDEDYNDNEQQKRKEFSIQELLGLQSDDNDIDNHYYEDYDDDYE